MEIRKKGLSTLGTDNLSAPKLTRRRIELVFGTETFRRGEEYFRKGHVLKATVFRDSVYGEVLGTSRYRTKLELVNGIHSDCSCEVGKDCKHGAALALHYLKGKCDDGDKAFEDLGGAGKFELLKAFEKLIEDDPMLLPKVASALRVGNGGDQKRPQYNPRLIASVEKRVKSMLRELERDGRYAGWFVQSFASLVKSNKEYMSKELIFFALEFLVENTEDHGWSYDDDYSDSMTFGGDFENLCDALVSKSLDEGDFERIVELLKHDQYDMLDPFIVRLATPDNARALSKMPSSQNWIKKLLAEHHGSLYVEFLINAGRIDEAKSIIVRDAKGLNEGERFELYLKINENEALEFARGKRYYDCLAEYYHEKGAHKEVTKIFRTVVQGETLRRWLNSDRVESSFPLSEIFDSLNHDRPSDYEGLARELFKISYRMGEYELCVDVGISLDDPKLLYKLLERRKKMKNSYYLFGSEPTIKLLEHLARSDPERSVYELKPLIDEFIGQKKDYSYDMAVKCALIIKKLIEEESWRTYLGSLNEAHYRKINLWKSFKSKGVSQPDR